MSELLDSASLLKLNNVNSLIRRKRINLEMMELKNNYAFVTVGQIKNYKVTKFRFNFNFITINVSNY